MQRLAERIEVNVFDETFEIERIIADVRSKKAGNTVVFLGGVHGNEPLGILAIKKVFDHIKEHKLDTVGRAIAITGNMEGTKLTQRYLYRDLNRVWTRENLDDLHYGNLDLRHTEHREMKDVYDILQEVIADLRGDLIVIDLHTTSAPTIPFVVTNKLKKCKEFTQYFPMPAISGLAGFLDGTLLSYINELGHVGLAYEAGQHKSHKAYTRHESFVWLSLMKAGILTDVSSGFEDFHYNALLEELTTRNNSFKIISRYKIHPGEEFKMEPGYTNFQRIHEGEILAKNNKGPILSPYDGYIFMPLYQRLGDDGFFIIKPEE